jgi:dTDP-4-dehydrorhamnose 3,5-epimerase
MKFIQTSLSGVVKVIPTVHRDQRGYFMEVWHKQRFGDAGIDTDFVQENFSQSFERTLRGLHYQIEHAQGKLVRVVSGEVFDVAVDLRRSAASFGQWVGEVLSAENGYQLWVPPGFAHGFLVLSDVAELEYKCTDYFAPEYERSIRCDDPEIAIEWPLATGKSPLLSEKDAAAPFLSSAETYT